MASKVKDKPTPLVTYNACIQGIAEGRKQKEVYESLGISRVTLTDHLKKHNTSWTKLLTLQKPIETSKGKDNGSQTQPRSNHSCNNTLPPEGIQPPMEEGTEIPAEIKEISRIMQYFKAHDLQVRFTEILAWKDKTNQLEDKSEQTDINQVQLDEQSRLKRDLFTI